jgi:hypothetical protein
MRCPHATPTCELRAWRTDEAAGKERLRLAAASKAQREREQADLRAKNREMRARLKKLKPQVAITSREGAEKYDDPSWLTPFIFESQFSRGTEPKVRYPSSPDQEPAPSWLQKTEVYEYAA